MKPRALLYARVSTADKGQDWHAQIEELENVAGQRGWTVVGHYHDEASGGRADRPGLAAAVARARGGSVDIFAAVSVDRFARSVPHLLALVEELEACGTKVSATREGAMDATTPQGRAFLIVRGAFAELERGLRREAVREGLAIRRARGVLLGRRPTGVYVHVDRVRELRAAGKSWTEVAGELGGTVGGWERALKRAAAA